MAEFGAPRVVCIGIATLDAIAVVDEMPGEDGRVNARDAALAGGGIAATASVALARLGVPVACIGRVGDDDVGRRIRADLAAEGVDIAGLRLVPEARSPLSVVLVNATSGRRALAPYAGDGGPIELTPVDIERCAAADWVHVDHAGWPAVAALRAAGVRTPISVDAGTPIPDLDLAGVTLYAPTEAALAARYPGRDLESSLRAALADGPRLVVATRGAGGSVAAERRSGLPGGVIVHHVSAPSGVPLVSTLGAGDVFHGALLAALLTRPDDVAGALRVATAAATLSCRALDGRTAIPTAAELRVFLGPAPGTDPTSTSLPPTGGADAVHRP